MKITTIIACLLFALAPVRAQQIPAGGQIHGVSGNGPTLVTTTGPQASGDAIVIDANGNHVDSGSAPAGAPPANAGFLGTNAAGQFIITAPVTAAPGYPLSQPTGGCGLEYPPAAGLSVTVGACAYLINGNPYTSAQQTVTAGAADATYDRFDVIAVNTAGSVIDIPGTPAANPTIPVVSSDTQLYLTAIYIAANATSLSNVTVDNIFDEGTEWTPSYTAHFALSTVNPYHLTHAVRATSAVLGNDVKFVVPSSGTIDLAATNALVFYIDPAAVWPTGTSGATAARYLSVFWENGTTQKGNQVVVRDGTFGFKSASNLYQQISIPNSQFGINGIPVTALLFQISGPTGTSSLTFDIDEVTLQGGLGAPALPASVMNFRGAWNSTVQYSVNDVVQSNGFAFIAKIANTNVAVTASATWQPFGGIQTFGVQFGTIGGSALSSTTWACTEVYWSGTILQVDLVADVSGSGTVDVLTVAKSSWAGVGSGVASITASDIPALSSAIKYTDSTLTGWTKTLTANTEVCGKLTSPSTLGWVGMTFKVLAN